MTRQFVTLVDPLRAIEIMHVHSMCAWHVWHVVSRDPLGIAHNSDIMSAESGEKKVLVSFCSFAVSAWSWSVRSPLLQLSLLPGTEENHLSREISAVVG